MRYSVKTMERKFGHCIANWTIENSRLLPLNSPFEILSPEFEVRGFTSTKWVMKLKNKEIDNEFQQYFQLDKLDSDKKDLHFLGQCNVEISSKINNVISFHEDFTWEINSKEKVLNKCLQPNHSYEILLHNLHIQCKLFIVFVSVEEDIETCRDVGLRELSQDLLRLYESERYTDVILEVNDKDSVFHIKAHKLILHSRNTILRNLLYSDEKHINVDDSGRFDEWKNIVKFLYTADMKHVLNPPRVFYYDIAVAYNIEPIISYFEPDKVNLHSTIPLEEFAVTCTIPEFTTNNEICIEIPRLISGSQDTSCKISVYPRSFSNESDTCICIKIRGEMSKSILVEIFACKAYSKKLLNWICGKKENNTTCEKRSFHKREMLNSFVQDGNLTLIFLLQIVNPNLLTNSTSYSSTNIKCKPFSNENNFRILSRDMMKFYYDCNLEKVQFTIGEEEYFIHKCILFIRAEFLFDKIRQCKIVKYEKARRRVIIHLIYFLYTGKYTSSFNLQDVLALYDIADSFNVETLKRILIRTIELNLHKIRTEDLLKVFYFIDSQNMPNLKTYARKVLDSFTINKFIKGTV